MTVEQLTLLAFVSAALVAGALFAFARSLMISPDAASTAGAVSGRRLRRVTPLTSEAPSRDLGTLIDRGFNRLVLESGTQIVPATAFLVCLAGAVLFGGVALVSGSDPLIAVGSAIIGLLIPLSVLSIRRSVRVYKIRQELPHVLDMMARATRAGQSVEQSVDLVANEAGGILGHEFSICTQQLSMGRSFERVFKSLAMRVRLIDVRILTTTVIVQKQAGGRLSETLERMAGVIRDRLSSHRQIRASTGAGRASTLVVASIAPIAYVFVYLFHRDHIQILFENELGRMLLATALILELVGLAWVFYLLRSDA